MEILHCLLQRAARFVLIPFHPKCRPLSITHLCFVDDLLVFTNGFVDGVRGVFDVLNMFLSRTGLQLNPEKNRSGLFYNSAAIGPGSDPF